MNTRFTHSLVSVFSLLITMSCTEATKQNIQDVNHQQHDNVSKEKNLSQENVFFENTMNSAPFLPQNQNDKYIHFQLPVRDASLYLGSRAINYQDYGWEQRIARDWRYFDSNEDDGKILLIDIKQNDNGPVYRYLSNGTQNQVYEPWSSSKIFAYTGAMAQLRKQAKEAGMGSEVALANGNFGQVKIADMITTVNSYEDLFDINSSSNELASFFANVATRDYLTSLFFDEWLKLSQKNIYFRGAYGPSAYVSEPYWKSADNTQTLTLEFITEASDDPGYLAYRCDKCGLTGNKPMTTLAQAEWLKRLAMHQSDTSTAHPELTQSDIQTLFYGDGHSGNSAEFAGMTVGISTMLQQAVAHAIVLESTGEAAQINPTKAKEILDDATNGKWRVFQKIGWGPSETRSTSENAVLAYVTLPNYKGGKAFVVAAQASVDEAADERVALAGLKMQALLNQAMEQYLR